MAMNSERRSASAGMAGGFLAILALLFVVSGLMLGLGPRHDDMILIDASSGEHQ
jgi:hypothetical protein